MNQELLEIAIERIKELDGNSKPQTLPSSQKPPRPPSIPAPPSARQQPPEKPEQPLWNKSNPTHARPNVQTQVVTERRKSHVKKLATLLLLHSIALAFSLLLTILLFLILVTESLPQKLLPPTTIGAYLSEPSSEAELLLPLDEYMARNNRVTLEKYFELVPGSTELANVRTELVARSRRDRRLIVSELPIYELGWSRPPEGGWKYYETHEGKGIYYPPGLTGSLVGCSLAFPFLSFFLFTHNRQALKVPEQPPQAPLIDNTPPSKEKVLYREPIRILKKDILFRKPIQILPANPLPTLVRK